jgi:DNA modification methylase
MVDGGVKVIDQARGANWHLWNGDCVDVVRGLPSESVGYSIYSPPFISLYTFSDDPRDMSNCRTDGDFWQHYRFLIAEIYRVLKPGRLVSVHCMNLPTSKLRDGFIGIRDFRGDIIKAHQEAGFIFHSEVVIRKDPVSAMQRTKAIGLLHKQIKKDSAISRMAIPDYIVTLRKPGNNPEPVVGMFDAYYGAEAGPNDPLPSQKFDPNLGRNVPVLVYPGEERYSIAVWQRYAEPVWLDIAQSDVLSRKDARDEADEAHIAPLQLTPIRRCLELWSNPGDVVLSPFAGIGSELYVSLQMGRRAIGAELKPSYFQQAVQNCERAEVGEGKPLVVSKLHDEGVTMVLAPPPY